MTLGAAVVASVLLVAALAVATTTAIAVVVPSANLTRAPYAEWGNCAGDQPCKNQEGILRLVREFIEHDLPVDNINVDSGWETNFNSFIVDTNKYPNMAQLIADVHSLGSHITFWMTSHINMESENYQFAKDRGYLLNDGKLVPWWHGDGALFDFTHPDGLNWYKTQMNVVLDIGADGWKLDASDPYVYLLYPAQGYQGRVTKEQYSDLYYRTFYDYSRERNSEALIMSRPIDVLPPGYKHTLRIPFTPVDICVAGWVGDQDPGFYGMQAAMLNMFASAKFNYVNLGSDIGGFRSDTSQWGVNGRPREAFIRWAQMGALVPFMENGGNNEHRPWVFGNDILETYRIFMNLHKELMPFWLSKATEAFETGISVMQPQGKCFWNPGESFPYPDPCTYEYKLADDIFVAPVYLNETTREVHFPVGDLWLDWWDERTIYEGNTTVIVNVPLSTMPLYRRVGSIIPLRVMNAHNRHDYGMNLKALPDLFTLLITHPFEAAKANLMTSAFGTVRIHERQGPGIDIRYWAESSKDLFVSVTATEHPIVLVISGIPTMRQVLDFVRIEPVCTSISAAECPALEPLSTDGFRHMANTQLQTRTGDSMDPAYFDMATNIAYFHDTASERLLIFVPSVIAVQGAMVKLTTRSNQ